MDQTPLVVFYDGSDYWLGDGYFRLMEAKAAGVKGVNAIGPDGAPFRLPIEAIKLVPYEAFETSDIPVGEINRERFCLKERLARHRAGKYVESMMRVYQERPLRLPAVTVMDIEGELCLVDGQGRLAAVMELGLPSIRTTVLVGNYKQGFQFWATANHIFGNKKHQEKVTAWCLRNPFLANDLWLAKQLHIDNRLGIRLLRERDAERARATREFSRDAAKILEAIVKNPGTTAEEIHIRARVSRDRAYPALQALVLDNQVTASDPGKTNSVSYTIQG